MFQVICLSKFHSKFFQRSTYTFHFRQGKQEIDTLDIDENSQNILNIIKDTSSQLPEGNRGLQFPSVFLTPSVHHPLYLRLSPLCISSSFFYVRSLCYVTTRLLLTIFHMPVFLFAPVTDEPVFPLPSFNQFTLTFKPLLHCHITQLCL